MFRLMSRLLVRARLRRRRLRRYGLEEGRGEEKKQKKALSAGTGL